MLVESAFGDGGAFGRDDLSGERFAGWPGEWPGEIDVPLIDARLLRSLLIMSMLLSSWFAISIDICLLYTSPSPRD